MIPTIYQVYYKPQIIKGLATSNRQTLLPTHKQETQLNNYELPPAEQRCAELPPN